MQNYLKSAELANRRADYFRNFAISLLNFGLKELIMKRIFLSLISLFAVIASQAQFNLGDLLNNLGNGSGDGIGDAIQGVLGGVLSTDKLQMTDLNGTWNYDKPAVCFKSENLLQKAGGAAVASTIEGKLQPYYKMTGLDKVVFTVEPDSTFVFKVRSMQLRGTVELLSDSESNSNMVLHFQAFKKVNLGSINCYVVKNSANNSLDLMFDMSKLITIAEKVSSLANSSKISAVVNLLKSYDGLCAGFELKNAQ